VYTVYFFLCVEKLNMFSGGVAIEMFFRVEFQKTRQIPTKYL